MTVLSLVAGVRNYGGVTSAKRTNPPLKCSINRESYGDNG